MLIIRPFTSVVMRRCGQQVSLFRSDGVLPRFRDLRIIRTIRDLNNRSGNFGS